ncbi:MAG: hypothetical protein JOS17DRAFT_423136 [Linnemannia elongata]|nr:MAG: hypothetical protein JOS17DRAFT_423136 [Linnemannia elongata]
MERKGYESIMCAVWWVSMGLALKVQSWCCASICVVGGSHGGIVEVDRAADRVVVFVIVVLVAVAVQVLTARAVVAIRDCGGVSKEATASRGVRK